MVLDTDAEPMFDTIARMAAEVCGTSIALVSLVDDQRQWFKANVGLEGTSQTPRDHAFCAHAILEEGIFEIPDAQRDPRFVDNPLVTGAPGIRFYAGAPLAPAGGQPVGTLCVLDHAARQLSAAQRASLRNLSELVTQALVMRRDLLLRSLSVRSRYEQALADSESRFRAMVEDQAELISQSRADGTLVYVNPAYARFFGRTQDQMIGTSLYTYVAPADRDLVREDIERTLRAGRNQTTENRLLAADGTARWVAWTNTVQSDAQHGVLLHSVGRDVTERHQVATALAESERFVTQITDSLPVRVTYVDRALRYRFVNKLHCDYLGLPRERILGHTRAELRGEPDSDNVRRQMQAVLRGEPQHFEHDDTVQGQRRRYETRLLPDVAEDGSVRGFFGASVDITERSAAEQAQRDLSNTLQAITEAIPAVVGVVGPDERYRFVNAACARWAGQTREQMVGQSIEQILGEQVYAQSQEEIRRALAGESVSVEREAPVRRGVSAHLAISYSPLYLEGGAVDGIVILVQDISNHKREAVRLLNLAQRDALTGLLNRAGLEAFLEQRMAETMGPTLGVLYVDLDRFKPVNDTYGHPLGDRVLQECARRMAKLVRPTDAVARLGGDEFAVVLCGLVDAKHARKVADKIVEAMHQPFELEGHVLRIGASVGVAHGARQQDGWQALVARADKMLYRAKQGGRGRQEAEEAA